MLPRYWSYNFAFSTQFTNTFLRSFATTFVLIIVYQRYKAAAIALRMRPSAPTSAEGMQRLAQECLGASVDAILLYYPMVSPLALTPLAETPLPWLRQQLSTSYRGDQHTV